MFFLLFYCKRFSRTTGKRAMCNRVFALCDRFAFEISYYLSHIYLLQKNEDCNLSEENFIFFKEITMMYFKLDLHYAKIRFLNQELAGN